MTKTQDPSSLTISMARQHIIDSIASGSLEIPVLPQVASRALAICSDPNSEIRELADVIKSDQALMGHLMRMANSALLAPEVPIVSLQLAVNRLGMGKVRDIAVSAACKSEVFKPGKHEELISQLFKSSLATGFYAQEIARLKRTNVEISFLAGLMANVGAPVIIHALENDELTLKELLEVTKDLSNEASVALLEAWSLPRKISFAAGHWRSPDEAEDCESLCRIIRLAMELSDELFSDPALDYQHSPGFSEDCGALSLYSEDLDSLAQKKDMVRSLVEAAG